MLVQALQGLCGTGSIVAFSLSRANRGPGLRQTPAGWKELGMAYTAGNTFSAELNEDPWTFVTSPGGPKYRRQPYRAPSTKWPPLMRNWQNEYGKLSRSSAITPTGKRGPLFLDAAE